MPCEPPALAAEPADMAQWCAPWRRQQIGRRASWLAGISAARGASQNNRTIETESTRRIYDWIVPHLRFGVFASGQVPCHRVSSGHCTFLHCLNRGSPGVWNEA